MKSISAYQRAALWLAFSGVLLSALVAWWVDRNNDRLVQERTAAVADDLGQRIQERFQLYEYGVRGARSAVLASGGPAIDRHRFRAYVGSGDIATEFPGARGFGFVRRVAPGDEAGFLAGARAEGPADFAIRELAAHTGEHFVIQYIYPQDNNQGATGLDLASEPRRREAALRAARDGQARLTAPITLVQASGMVRRGFLLLLPVYRTSSALAAPREREAAAFGWTYAPLVVDEVLADLGRGAQEVALTLTDQAESQPFFESGEASAAPGVTRPLNVQGRQWLLSARAQPALIEAARLTAPASVFAAGLGLTGLLTLALVLLLERRQYQLRELEAERRAWRRRHQPVNVGAFLRSAPAWRAALLLVVATVFLLAHTYFNQLRFQELQVARDLQDVVDEMAMNASTRFSERRRSVLFIASTPPVDGLVRAMQNNGIDPRESSTAALWTRRMQEIFTAFLVSEPQAHKVRFIGVDGGGREIVRVQRFGSRVAVVPEGGLGAAGDTSYFREAARLGKGQVFVSDVELNREAGQIERPERPTIRYATPVYDAAGRLAGVVVINVDVNGSQGVMAASPHGEPQSLYVTNARGEWLLHPQAGRAFAFERGDTHAWTDEFQPANREALDARTRWWNGPQGMTLVATASVSGNPESPLGELRFAATRGERALQTAALEAVWHQLPPLLLAGLLGTVLLYLYWVGVQRKLEVRNERLQTAAIVDQSTDAILGLDTAGRVTSWNRGAQRLFGHAPEEAVGQPLDALIAPEGQDGQALQDLSALPAGGDAPGMAVWCRTRDDRRVLVAMTVSGLHDEAGTLVGASAVLRDITAERAAQRHLEELKDSLEQEVRERTAALAEERERLDNILRGTDAGTWEWNVQTGETRFNERWAGIIGWRLEELQPVSIDTWTAHTHPDDLALSGQRLQAHFKGETDVYECEARMRHRDGSWVWVLDRGRVRTWTAQGEPEWMYGTHLDITESRRAQEAIAHSEALLRGAIGAVDEAFVLYDPDDRLVFCNDRYREVYPNVAHLMVRGNRFEDIVRAGAEMGDYRDAIGRVDEWVAERMAAHRAGAIELVQKLSNGRSMRVLERRMADGHTVGFRIDITDLVQAREAAQEASRIKGEFLANMSHEIRTPLNAMIGMTHLLGDTVLTGYQRTLLDKSQVAGRALLGLVNDVLDLAKIEAGGLDLERQPFSPHDLLEELDTLFRGQADTKDIRYTVEAGPGVPDVLMGDALRVRQIFTNLIGNALKFTQSGQVAVRLDVLDAQGEEGHAVRLRGVVRDTGVGIDAETRPRLFNPFTQADTSTTRQFGGTGLGLSIVRKLVERMGGAVGLVSEPGQGSEFSFDLVLETPSASERAAWNDRTDPTVAPPLAHGTALRGLHLLVVDDSDVNLEVARGLLQREGARVTLAVNGLEALERLRGPALHVDAVLMDLQMPGMDGLEATRRIRSEPGLQALPVIALTAGALAEERQRAFDAGMNGFLTKPLDPARLVRTVRDCVDAAARRGDPPAATAEALQGLAPDAGWPAIAGVDTADVAERLGGDFALWRKLVTRLFEEFDDLTVPGFAPVEHAQRHALKGRLHKLRGSAGTLGAHGVARCAAELEHALASDGQGQPQPRLYDAVRHALLQLRTACAPVLQAAWPAVSPGERAEPAGVDDAGWLRLLELLEQQDMDALDWWREHAGPMRQRLGAPAWDAIERLLDALDFAGARAILVGLAPDPLAPDPLAPGSHEEAQNA